MAVVVVLQCCFMLWVQLYLTLTITQVDTIYTFFPSLRTFCNSMGTHTKGKGRYCPRNIPNLKGQDPWVAVPASLASGVFSKLFRKWSQQKWVPGTGSMPLFTSCLLTLSGFPELFLINRPSCSPRLYFLINLSFFRSRSTTVPICLALLPQKWTLLIEGLCLLSLPRFC